MAYLEHNIPKIKYGKRKNLVWIWHFWSVPTDLVDFPWIFIHGTCFNQITQLKSLVNCLKLGKTVRVWIPVSSEGPLVGRIKRIIEHFGFNGIPWKSLNSQNSMEWDKHTYFRYCTIYRFTYMYIYIHPYYRIWYIYIHMMYNMYYIWFLYIYDTYICIYIYIMKQIIYHIKHMCGVYNLLPTCHGCFCSATRSCDATASCWSTLESGHLKGTFFFRKTPKETYLLRVGAENRIHLGFSRLMGNRLNPHMQL